jgi:hypothetical protein
MKVTSEHWYSTAERRQQLAELAAALPELITITRATPQVFHLVSQYESALAEENKLLRNGFNQEQLSGLSRMVPDAFMRHKEWLPPSEQLSDGQWREPEWYVALESKLQPVLKAAGVLRELGYY